VEQPMDDLTPDTDAVTFAKALYGWVGPHPAAYAEQREAALRSAGDIAGADAWSRVANAARQLEAAERKQDTQSRPTAVIRGERRGRRAGMATR
jgi:hypothetical protein